MTEAAGASFVLISGFPGGSDGKESASNTGTAGDAGLIPGLGRSAGGGNGNPLQYSCHRRNQWTEKPGAVHGVTKSQTRLSD